MVVFAKEVSSAPRVRTRSRITSIVAGLLIAVSCLSLSAYVVVHWAERQVLNTDNWVALVGPLPKQPVVYTALGNYVGNQVFQSVPLEQKIGAALPSRVDFLAGPLTNQLHDITNKAAQKVVASNAFQSIWIAANRTALDRLLNTARGQPAPLQSKLNEKFNLNISDISSQLRAVLGNISVAIPALQPGVEKAITVSVNLHAKADKIRQIIRLIDDLAVILPLLTVASFLSALALSPWRRRTTIEAVVTLIVLMLIELIAIKVLRSRVLGMVNGPANLSAISYIYDTLVAWLKEMIFIVIAVMAVVWVACVLGGTTKVARAFQSYIHIDYLKDSRFIKRWHAFRFMIAKWQKYILIASLVLILAILALFVTINVRSVINGLLLIVGIVSLIHILATPPNVPKPLGPVEEERFS